MKCGWWCLALLAVPTTARAYSAPGLYAAPADADGGGGGRFFTGSPADGFTCAVCHAGGEPPTLTLTGLPVGAYEPEAVYTIDLRISAGTRPGAALTSEVVDASGAALGQLALAPDEILTDEERCVGGSRAGSLHEAAMGRTIAALADCTATRLRFQWTAPAAGRGPAFFHVAAVASDGSGAPDGDGAALLVEAVAAVGDAPAGGCRVTSPGWLAGLLVLRRRRAATLMLLAAALTLTGCARVKPYERGRLAQPDMQVDPDPDLTAGQLHASEYREGSVGGEGGGGGGCGCN